MRLRVVVGKDSSLRWNGGEVRVPAEHAAWAASLKPGAALEVECRFLDQQATIDEPRSAVGLFGEPRDLEGMTFHFVDLGLLDEALLFLDARPETAEHLAARARVELERHRQANQGRVWSVPTPMLAEVCRSLERCFALGGPPLPLSAFHSPWRTWALLMRGERDAIAPTVARPLLAWAFTALERTWRLYFKDFTPVPSLLDDLRPEAWPDAPWLAWGLAPALWNERVLAKRLAPALSRLGLDDEERRRLAVAAEAVVAERPVAVGTTRFGVAGALRLLHEVVVSRRPFVFADFLEQATRRAPAAARAVFFRDVNDAVCIAELAALLGPQRDTTDVERVIFRGTTNRGISSELSVARLTSGQYLAARAVWAEPSIVVEGDLEAALSLVPAPLLTFARAVVQEPEA